MSAFVAVALERPDDERDDAIEYLLGLVRPEFAVPTYRPDQQTWSSPVHSAWWAAVVTRPGPRAVCRAPHSLGKSGETGPLGVRRGRSAGPGGKVAG